jgi:outer membrane protein assembly factor BamB
MVKLAIIPLLLLASLALAADWPVFRGDPALQGRVPGRVSVPLRRTWRTSTGKGSCTSPVIADGKVFVANDQGSLHCLDLATGRTLWAAKLGAPTEAPPMAHGGRVYIGTDNGGFFAFDATTGRKAWSFKAEDQIKGSANAVMAGDTPAVVVGSYDMFLYCLAADSGKLLWKLETENYVNGTPSVVGDRVAFGGCDGQFRQIRASDGKQLKTIDASSYIPGSAAIADGSAYFGQVEGQVRRLDLKTDKIVWTNEDARDGIFAPPALTKDLVLAASRDGRLYALDTATGKRKWQFRTGNAIEGGAIVDEKHAVFGSTDGRLYIVALATGKQVWSYDLGSAISTSPAFSNGWLVVCTDDGAVQAFR